jgi:hypothetical protein
MAAPRRPADSVFERVHRKFNACVAVSVMSLSKFLRALLSRETKRPTPQELAARIAARERVSRRESSEEAVRRLRASGE